MDLSTFSTAELKAALGAIPAEIARREKAERQNLRKELEDLAAKHGYSLDDLLAGSSKHADKFRKPVAVKYKHPQNAELTWTGRGRQPLWIASFIANGGTLEQLQTAAAA